MSGGFTPRSEPNSQRRRAVCALMGIRAAERCRNRSLRSYEPSGWLRTLCRAFMQLTHASTTSLRFSTSLAHTHISRCRVAPMAGCGMSNCTLELSEAPETFSGQVRTPPERPASTSLRCWSTAGSRAGWWLARWARSRTLVVYPRRRAAADAVGVEERPAGAGSSSCVGPTCRPPAMVVRGRLWQHRLRACYTTSRCWHCGLEHSA